MDLPASSSFSSAPHLQRNCGGARGDERGCLPLQNDVYLSSFTTVPLSDLDQSAFQLPPPALYMRFVAVLPSYYYGSKSFICSAAATYSTSTVRMIGRERQSFLAFFK